jgi:hypothetical protein
MYDLLTLYLRHSSHLLERYFSQVRLKEFARICQLTSVMMVSCLEMHRWLSVQFLSYSKAIGLHTVVLAKWSSIHALGCLTTTIDGGSLFRFEFILSKR